MITTLPGRAARRSRARRHAAARASRPTVVDEDGDEVERRHAGPARRCAGRGRGCCARSTSDDDRFVETYWDEVRPATTYFVGDAAARATTTATSGSSAASTTCINVSGHRMSTAEIESAIVSHPKVAEAAVIGQSDEDTGQSIGAFVTLEGDARGRRRARRRDPRARRQADRQARAAQARSSGPTTCRRPARARSCAACCATSPRAASSATSRRCATPT